MAKRRPSSLKKKVEDIAEKSADYRERKQKELTVKGARPEMKRVVVSAYDKGDEVWHSRFGYGIIKNVEKTHYEISFGGSMRRIPKEEVKNKGR